MEISIRTTELLQRLLRFSGVYFVVGAIFIALDILLLPTLGGPIWLMLFLFFAAVVGIPTLLAYHWMTWRAEPVDETDEAGEVWFLDRPIPSVTGRPSIAIMALDGEEPSIALTGLGLSGEVIDILTQEASIFVISGNTSLFYQGREFDMKRTASALGVTYILTGSIEITDGIASISITLWNGQTEAEIWTEQFQYTEPRIFSFPPDVVAKIGTTLTGQFVSWDPAHVRYFPPPDAESWLKFVRAKTAFKIDNPRTYGTAIALAKVAVASAPEFGRARAFLAQVLAVTVSQSLSHNKQADTAVALEAANAALNYTHDNHEALAEVARSLLHLGQHARAQQIAKNAEQKMPDSGPIASILGFCNLSFGRAELAIFDYGRALRLSPKDAEVSSWLVAVGICNIILGKLDEAIAHLCRAVEMSPDMFLFWQVLANTYGLAGEVEKGRAALEKVMELLPSFSVEIAEASWQVMFADPDSAQLLTAGHAKLIAGEDALEAEVA